MSTFFDKILKNSSPISHILIYTSFFHVIYYNFLLAVYFLLRKLYSKESCWLTVGLS